MTAWGHGLGERRPADWRGPAEIGLQAGRFLDELRTEFPHFRIRAKQGNGLSRLIDFCLRLVTLGGQDKYLTHYQTVIGSTLYVAEAWAAMSDVDRVILLRHERVHLRQRKRLTLPVMAAWYLIPIFPIGLAYGRARLEWEAYQETLRATLELKGQTALTCAGLRRQIVGRFLGPDYGWMWPFRAQVEGWYDQTVRKLIEELSAHRSG